MKKLSFDKPIGLAIAEGATSPVPAYGAGCIAYSTTLNKQLVWTGTVWQSEGRLYDQAVVSGTLAAGSLIYIKSDGTISLADATAQGKEAIGFVLRAYTDAQIATYYTSGETITGLSGLTPGASYVMSTTPGGIVILSNAPSAVGNVLMKVGSAKSTTSLLFNPSLPLTL
jgi:hypothetical protein